MDGLHAPSHQSTILKVLDLFCGEGGAGWGYYRADFDVFGVDNNSARLSHYPLPHVQGDALQFLAEHGHEFDFIHASPPCQGYSRGTIYQPRRLERYDRLIAATRDLLMETGKPWVIENVMGAKPELLSPFMLCGRMFYLTATDTDGTHLVLDRHRLFETSPGLTIKPPVHYKHDTSVQVAGVYGGARRDKIEARTVRKGGYVPADPSVLRALIGAEWMTIQGLFLSIPPAYTSYIAQELTNQGIGSSLNP